MAFDGLLEQDTDLAPRKVTRDGHDYADEMLLGLFLFLGYLFPPLYRP